MPDIIFTGYPSIDSIIKVEKLPNPNETAIIDEDFYKNFKLTYGGCAVNASIIASQLGAKVGLSMVVGYDFRSSGYEERLTHYSIDISDVLIVKEKKTSQTFIFFDNDGNQMTFFYPGAAIEKRGTVPTLRNVRLVCITVGNPFHIEKIARKSISNNIPIVWNLKKDVYSYPSHLVDLLSNNFSYIVCNNHELEFLLKHRDLKDLFARKKAQAIIVTQGENGAKILKDNQVIHIITPTPKKVIDPTGAGDAFLGAFCYGINRGFNIEKSVELGTVLGSFAVEEMGAQIEKLDKNKIKNRYLNTFSKNLIL